MAVDNQSLQRTFPEAWRDFSRKRLLYWLSVACLFLGVIAVCAVRPISALFWPRLIVIAVLLSVSAYAYGELFSFACPRCHKAFLLFWPIYLRSGCAHCGLPKREDLSV